MMQYVLSAVRVLWLTACVSVLAWTIWEEMTSADHHVGMVFAFTMMALTLPASILVMTGFGAISLLIGTDNFSLPNHWSVTVVFWPALVVPGYLQWFVLAPLLTGRRSDRGVTLDLDERR